ncbi:pentapeptide repeat-containing protein, partial [Bacillus pseudomycoides]|nr:pentapeptide repeat-containing protein [Bacillus pseudomycoides]
MDAEQAECIGADCKSTNFTNDKFEKLDLKNANLSEVDTRNADFTSAD